MSMSDLFKEIIPSILQTKKPVVDSSNEREYIPFVVNKALSFHYDTILYANEMNSNPGLDGLLQYQFLINTIRGYKRPFQKWIKQDKLENLELIKEYYGFSNEKAKEALSVLTDEQLEEIKNRMFMGGTMKR